MGVRLLHEQRGMPRRRPDISLRRVVTLLAALAAIGDDSWSGKRQTLADMS